MKINVETKKPTHYTTAILIIQTFLQIEINPRCDFKTVLRSYIQSE